MATNRIGKGRTLDAVQSSASKLLVSHDPDVQSLLDRLSQARNKIAELIQPALTSRSSINESNDLLVYLRAQTDLENKLSDKSPDYHNLLAPVSFATVQERLADGHVLVEYLRYPVFDRLRAGRGSPWKEKRYAAMVLRNGRTPQWFDLGDASEIDRHVEELRNNLRNKDSSEYTSSARDLYELVLSPLEGELRELVFTKVPLIMSSSCTNGVAAHEDNHTGTQRRVYRDGGFDWAAG